jgi:16S rRNA (uracil1498-N3)-methyltransferase
MARRRFFVPEIRRGAAELTGPEAEHLVRVLRAEPGQVYELSDNSEVYLAEIVNARKASVTFKILEKLATPQRHVTITLLPALFKFARFEWMLEKVTELGVSIIQPVEAVRSERGLAQAFIKRHMRWQRILTEASQQSRRAHLPRIEQVFLFSKALGATADIRLLLDEEAAAPPILAALPSAATERHNIALLIGPEGGWTEGERQHALKEGWTSCSLGATILRAETAAVAALAIVQAWASKMTAAKSLEEQSPLVPVESLPEN